MDGGEPGWLVVDGARHRGVVGCEHGGIDCSRTNRRCNQTLLNPTGALKSLSSPPPMGQLDLTHHELIPPFSIVQYS